MAWMSDERYILFSDSREKKSIAASAHKQRTHCGKGGSVKFPSDYLSKKEIKAMSGECKTYRMSEPLTWEEFAEWPNEHKVTYIQSIRERFGASDKYIAEMFDVSGMTLGMWIKDLGLEPMNECDENWDRDVFVAWKDGDWAEPMTWDEFKKLSNDKKREYITGLREKFGVPDVEIANMFGIYRTTLCKWFREWGLGNGKGSGGKRNWDNAGWAKWLNAGNVGEVYPVEEPEEEPVNIPEGTDVEEIAKKVVEELIPEQGFTEGGCCEKKRVIPKSGTMTFVGDIDDILNSIRLILEGSQVEITMSWTVKE